MTSVFGQGGITRAQTGALFHPGYISGGFYPLAEVTTVQATVGAADVVYLHFFTLFQPVTFTSLFMRCTAGGTLSEAKMAVWRAANGRPVGVPIIGNNTGAATTSPAVISQAIANVTLPQGGYFFGSKHTGSPLPNFVAITANRSGALYGATAATAAMPASATGQIVGLTAPDAYANDIMALDLTSATFTAVTSNTLPLGGGGFA